MLKCFPPFTKDPIMVDIIRISNERDVMLTIGTDYLNPWMTPGAAFHRELELLVFAGIPALDVGVNKN